MKNCDPDDSFAEILAYYDTILASGQSDSYCETVGDEVEDHQVRRRLDEAKHCLRFLEDVWPRSQPDVMQAPASVARFRIVRELGRGGFGIVYLANDDKLARQVALKLQRPEAIVSAHLRDRFISEARSAGSLHHANIATIYEVGQAGVRIWLATEYCDGGSLAQWLSAVHPTASTQSVAVFMTALADAIQYSHLHGVLHRDIKPSNILLQRTTDLGTSNADDLSNYVPKLIDFGLAKNLSDTTQDTRTGALIGTPAYMAPEQAQGRHELIGPATDVYGLGLILYELLTGRPAFVGDSDLAILAKVGNGDFAHPRTVRRELPRDLEAICLKCLHTRPSERYGSAADFAADLRRFLLAKPTLARPLTVPQRAVQWSRRRPAVAALLAVSLLGSLLLMAMTALHVTRLREARDATDTARRIAEQNALQSKQHETAAQQLLYNSRITLAMNVLDHGDDEIAMLHLAPYATDPALAHLRGFEWHYLQRRLFNEAVTLRGHEGECYCVLFSPDDRSVVSAGQDGTIRFWDKATGKQRRQIKGHSSCVNSISLSADGKLLASGGCDGMVHVWSAATGEWLRTLRQPPSIVECVAFSPAAADRLAGCGSDGSARVWDASSGELVRSFDTRANSVKSVVWSRDGQTLHIVACHTVPSQTQLFAWQPNEDLVQDVHVDAQSLAISPVTGELYVGMVNSGIRKIMPRDATTEILSGHLRQVDCMAFSPDGAWLASGSEDSRIRLWDSAKKNYLRTLSGHTARVQSLAFDRQGATVASASFDHTVKLWSLSDGSQLVIPLPLPAHPTPLRNRLALSPDLRRVAILATSDRLEVRNLVSRQVLASAQVPPVCDVQFADDGQTVVAKSCQGPPKLYLWKDNLASVASEDLPFQGAYVANADASSVAGCDPYGVVVRDRASGTTSFRRGWSGSQLPSTGWEIYLSPNGKRFGIHSGKFFKSWIVQPGKPDAVRELPKKLVAVDDSGHYAIVEHNPLLFSFALIETQTGRQRAILTPRNRNTYWAFSPDSKTIASGGENGTVSLWNVATGQAMLQLPTHSSHVLAVQFSSDSRALAAIVADRVIKADGLETGSVRVFVWAGQRQAD